MGVRQTNQAKLLQAAIVMPVQEFVQRISKRRQAGDDPFGNFSDRELIRAVESSSKAFGQIATFERLARGLSTSNDQVNVTATSLDARVAEAREKAQGMSRSELDTFLEGAAAGALAARNVQQSDAGSRGRTKAKRAAPRKGRQDQPRQAVLGGAGQVPSGSRAAMS